MSVESGVPVEEPVRAPWWTFDLHTVPAPLRRYIFVILAAGLTVLAACIALLVIDDRDFGLNFTIILGLYFVASLVPAVELNRNGERMTYRFNEFPTLLGLAIGPAYLVPLAAAASDLLDMARDSKGGKIARYKILFNGGQASLTTGVVVLIGSIAPPISYIPAVLVGSILSDVLIYKAISLSGGPTVRESMQSGWDTRVGIPTFVAIVSAVFVMFVPSGDTRLLIVTVPMVAVVLYFAGREWIATNKDREQWQRLPQISRKMVETYDEKALIRLALVGANELFGVSRTQITIYGIGEDGYSYALNSRRGEQIRATPLPAASPSARPGILRVEPGAVPSPESATTLVVEMTAQRRTIGHITLTFPESTRRPQDRLELATTFADTVAANLLNARNVKHAREQALARAHEATHDSLTGLGNRAMLYERGPYVLAEAGATQTTAALLLFDLDGFKRVNDTLGHHAGDRMLVEIGQRLQRTIRGTDLAVRLGGDEFAVLASGLHSAADAERLAAKLLRELQPTIEIEGLNLTAEASIGIAIAKEDADDIETLLRLADVAMYEAKSRGRGTSVRYSASSNTNSAESLTLTADLREGLARNELVMHYQPQIEVSTGKVHGIEALARWQHPTLGLLYPDKFVPIAEHSGLIGRFTRCVLESAIRDHATLRRSSPGMALSVNLSARNLMDQRLPEEVRGILAEHRVPAEEVVIEITETMALGETNAVERVIQGLVDLGCTISMDDFGTGHSSPTVLREHTLLSEVKVDRSFVGDILTNPSSEVIVRGTVELAHMRGCRVVAEGVEDAAILARLRALNVDVAQGYHIAKPMPLAQVREWLPEWTQTTTLLASWAESCSEGTDRDIT